MLDVAEFKEQDKFVTWEFTNILELVSGAKYPTLQALKKKERNK